MSDPTQPSVIDVSALPTLDEFIAARSGETKNFASRAYSAVAEPITKAVSGAAGALLDTASLAGPMARVPEGATTASQSMAPFTRSVGETVVPQTLTDAAILTATGGAGGIAATLGMKPLKSAATRILGATVGGAGGGLAEDTSSPIGAAVGAAKGLITGSIGEGIGGLTNFGRNVGVDRVRAKIQLVDAHSVGAAMEQNPKLGGVFAGARTPDDLRALALGTTTLPDGKVANTGILKLQAQQDTAQDAITALIAQRPAPSPLQGVGRTYPSTMGAGGPSGQPLLLTSELAGYRGQRAGWFPDPQNPKSFVPWDEWKKSYSELGTKAFGGPKGNPLEPTILGVDTKQRWAEAGREVRQYLTSYDPSGQAVRLFTAAQEQYEAGRFQLQALRKAFTNLRPNEIAFNSDAMQKFLSVNETKATKKLGPEGYAAQIRALNHGGDMGPGFQDQWSAGGLLSRMAEIVPGPGGTYARLRVGEPSIIGNPLNLTQGQRTGLTLGTQAAGLQLGNQATQGLNLQGLTGLPPLSLAPGQSQP